MEKKKRSSPRRSLETAILPKSPLLYENYKSGCGLKLIKFFDFRHVKSGNKRLSSEKKFIRDSSGNVYTKSQLNLLKKLHEKCQCHDHIAEDENFESKPVHGFLEREIRRMKNLKDETCENSEEINLQVSVNRVSETLICSKEKARSKQFMEALDILSSNKEFFTTLLQDPNSFSAKKGQDFEGSKVTKPQEDTSLSMADDKVYLRFRHLAKKLKLVNGSNKPECIGFKTKAVGFRTSDVSTSIVGCRSPGSPVIRRKKRVESDVFELRTENDVLPRRFSVERLKSSPVYEGPYASSNLQTKLKERRQKLEKRRENFKLWSLDKKFEVFNPNPNYSNLKSLGGDCTSSDEYRSMRTHVKDGFVEYRFLESSLQEPNSSLERTVMNVHDTKHEQEQPSPVSVLEMIHLEDETVSNRNVKSYKLEEQIGISFNDQNLDLDSVHEFVKNVLEASRLNWTNLMKRCSQETSLLNKFSHFNHNNNNDQYLLVLDYTDEILREVYRQNIKLSPSKKTSRREDLIQETLRCFDWSLVCSDYAPRTLDEIIEIDLVKTCVWLEFGGEFESVVSDVVEKILEEMMFEICYELRTMKRRVFVD